MQFHRVWSQTNRPYLVTFGENLGQIHAQAQHEEQIF